MAQARAEPCITVHDRTTNNKSLLMLLRRGRSWQHAFAAAEVSTMWHSCLSTFESREMRGAVGKEGGDGGGVGGQICPKCSCLQMIVLWLP